jgi:hypothetical protein
MRTILACVDRLFHDTLGEILSHSSHSRAVTTKIVGDVAELRINLKRVR